MLGPRPVCARVAVGVAVGAWSSFQAPGARAAGCEAQVSHARLNSRLFASSSRREGPSHAKQSNPRVIRIALTGGPCAGKSSALGQITQEATARGFDVYSAPETPTLLFHTGAKLPAKSDGEEMFHFQRSLMQLQLQIEASLTSIARSTGRPTIIIFDRGLLDPRGYMAPEIWDRVLGSLSDGSGRSVDETRLLARYEGVIHLVTAADGAEEFYKWGKVADDSGKEVSRTESPEEARALDVKMQECWRGHPNHMVIHNTVGGFKAKLKDAESFVLRIAEESATSVNKEQ
uniref:NadR/Ttd14 AAA domain-containing protein n=1 Tax=Rhizochromulina marina TaxID=1034831 RepID=A0A7S2ST68_9STRA|mmetsp:Transcript_6987/g.20192  ORF Transcript_6987/g.20192 Transcript_6987/m.20192 type:complete len:289 (+) Transcript_6987:19-885(+)